VTNYDPFAHADALGIQVVHRTLTTANGMWLPDLRLIFLQKKMRSVNERSVLSHEIGHAVLGHRQSTRKHEVQADRWAVRKLINPEHVVGAAALTDDIGAWCHELNVSADILDRYLQDRREAS
jgi:Zn-dependent peptidase ImmA (M78 family)